MTRSTLLLFLLLLLATSGTSLAARLPLSENSLPEAPDGRLLKLNSCLDVCDDKWKDHASHERRVLTAKCWDNCFISYAGRLVNSMTSDEQR